MSASNRKYKDSVFVDLFSEDEKAKENFLMKPLSFEYRHVLLRNVFASFFRHFLSRTNLWKFVPVILSRHPSGL